MSEYRLELADAHEFIKTLPDGSVDCVLTDPPYGIAYQSAWRSDKLLRHRKIENDEVPCTSWLPGAARALKLGGCLICFHRWDVGEIFRAEIEAAGLTIKSQIVWDKITHGMGDLNGEFAPQHELAFFAVKGAYKFPGARPKTIIRSTRIQGDKMIHPTEKPDDLMAQILKAITRPGDLVIDPFSGSGSTGAACIKLGRNFIGCEIDSTYYETAKRRLEAAAANVPLFAPT